MKNSSSLKPIRLADINGKPWKAPKPKETMRKEKIELAREYADCIEKGIRIKPKRYYVFTNYLAIVLGEFYSKNL